MLLSVLLLLVGLVVLYFGAEYLVKGASSIALSLGMTPLLVGLTVVAFGTSMPELVVSLLAAMAGTVDIAVGNVVGSNIANIALIVGVAALITPMAVDRALLRRDYWWMLAFSLGLWALAYFDGSPRITRGDAMVLLVPFAAYILLSIYGALKQRQASRVEVAVLEAHNLPEEAARAAIGVAQPEVLEAVKHPVPIWKSALFVVGGVVGLVIGAQLMVDNAVTIAKTFGMSDTVIGVTIVALGTSLPELATSVVAALRKEMDISLGNIVGSNIFNIGLVLGAVGLVHPMDIDPSALSFDILVMLGVTVLLFVVMIFKRQVSRLGGAALLAAYIAYMVVTFLRVSQAPVVETVSSLSGMLSL